jgi:hypothetical protein
MSNEKKDGFGLDKKSRAIATRLGKELEDAKAVAELEPPFPYVVQAFDPAILQD